MSLVHLLLRQARLDPDRTTVFNGNTPWATHAQWAARSAGLAQRLRAAGLAPGDRIVLFMRNHPRYLEALWGAWWAGLVVVPVNAKLHPREAEWIIDNAQARWAFVTHDVAAEPLAGLVRQVDVETPEADALFAPGLMSRLTLSLPADGPHKVPYLCRTSPIPETYAVQPWLSLTGCCLCLPLHPNVRKETGGVRCLPENGCF